MKIAEKFVQQILEDVYPQTYRSIYDSSMLIQYLDKKMKAVHGNSKARRSLANIYAVYSILHYYYADFHSKPDEYRDFAGYDYTRLLNHSRSLYGGSKLQNHSFNSRVNSEFKNKFPAAVNDLLIIENGKYLIHIDYLYVGETDISGAVIRIIEKYIELIIAKDDDMIQVLQELQGIDDYEKKKNKINELLTDDAEARVFEIISYAILKNHYSCIKAYFGYSMDDIREEELQLYKTGRTNANDGGIDFVMRPVGRFFQVTEVNSYGKYLLDIDKVMHFPISFVVKTSNSKQQVLTELEAYINTKANGMKVIRDRYKRAIEEIITINELKAWISELGDSDVDNIIRDIDIYYRLEMNMDLDSENEE